MKIYLVYILLLFVTVSSACQRERYRKDRTNKLTRKAKKAQHYLAEQAKEITQENIAEKDVISKRNRKRQLKEQERLNELNANSSKVKKDRNTKHEGKYSFY